MGSIESAIRKNDYSEFGIESWNALLYKTFGEINNRKNVYKGFRGLDIATEELLEFKRDKRRLPSAYDFPGIIVAIYRGEWAVLEITTWNHLMLRVFGKVNQIKGMYKGKDGLERAKTELKEFKEKFGRLPVVRDYTGIIDAAQRGEWKDQGITSWNDLLMSTFGEVNRRKNVYKGIEGLNLALLELESFRIENSRIPRMIDKGMSGMYQAVNRGEWMDYGYFSWNDLLKSVFGRINNRHGVYSGKEGLKLAEKEMLIYKDRNGRLPRSMGSGMRGIVATISSRKWEKYGISYWNDLLNDTFGKVNHRYYSYKGKHGLTRAKWELNKIKEEIGRLPRNRDCNVSGIVGAIRSKEWVELGIETWNDLLMSTFGEITQKQKVFKSIEGLKLAREVLEGIQLKEGRIPKNKDKEAAGIIGAIRRGEWQEQGILSWVDLLVQVFDEKVPRNRLRGRKEK
ncbi:MAG: hypothetical protein ACTSRU_12025 [Candidatus Hodarchaeales archaeon]